MTQDEYPEVTMETQVTNSRPMTIRKFGITMRVSAREHFEMVWRERYGAFKRRSHTEVVDPAPALVQKFSELKERWDKLYAEVLAAGLFNDDYCISGGPLREPRTEQVKVHDETEEEFQARVDKAYLVFEETGKWPRTTFPNGDRFMNSGRTLATAEWLSFLERTKESVDAIQ